MAPLAPRQGWRSKRSSGVMRISTLAKPAPSAMSVPERSGRNLPVNIDGMLGCVLTELGFTPVEMPGVAAISFMPGIVAHCVEEVTSPPTLRVADGLYTGEPTRHLNTI